RRVPMPQQDEGGHVQTRYVAVIHPAPSATIIAAPSVTRYGTNAVIRWVDTNLSSQATEAYATKKLTAVPIAVGSIPMPWPSAFGSSSAAAPISAGMPR